MNGGQKLVVDLAFKVNMSKEEYVKDFNWVKGWIDRHFFNKVSDTLLGIIVISVLVILLFKDKKIRKFRMKDFILVYLILLFFLMEWFLNHPSMRYGGFVLISLPIFILSSQFLETFNMSNRKKVLVVSLILISITFLIYNVRNFVRLNKEINFYNYNIIQSPFFLYKKMLNQKLFMRMIHLKFIHRLRICVGQVLRLVPMLKIYKLQIFYT